MAAANKLARTVNILSLLPGKAGERARSALLGRVVPLVGTAGLRIEEMTVERGVTSVHNRRKVRNHIGQLHAAAMALLAETASGFVVAMNLPGDKLPLIKTLRVDFKKRTRGAMRAVATLTDAQRDKMRTEPRGDVAVEVHVTDASGAEPIRCEMIWAWVPRKK